MANPPYKATILAQDIQGKKDLLTQFHLDNHRMQVLFQDGHTEYATRIALPSKYLPFIAPELTQRETSNEPLGVGERIEFSPDNLRRHIIDRSHGKMVKCRRLWLPLNWKIKGILRN